MNPHLAPKIRSEVILEAARSMRWCFMRLATYVSQPCLPGCEPVHLATIGKGMSTKVSDLFVMPGCRRCHQLYDGKDERIWEILKLHPTARLEVEQRAHHEFLSHLLSAGIISIPGAKII